MAALVAVFLLVLAPLAASAQTAGVQIQNLPNGVTLSGSDLVPAAQNGVTVKLTLAQLQTFFNSLGSAGPGGGTITSVTGGCGLAGGTITSGAGTLSLAAIVNNRLLGNVSGASACPGVMTSAQTLSLLGTGTAALANVGTTGAKVPLLNVPASWSAGQSSTPVALADAATITPDFAAGNVFTVTLGGNRTLANPTNLVAGKCGMMFVSQDSFGNRTLAFDTAYEFSGGALPTIATAPGATDAISFCVQSPTFIATNVVGNYPTAGICHVWRPTGTVINVTTSSNIQTTIDNAASGSVIVFANGTYNLNNINLKSGVSLMAANQFGAKLQGNASGNVLQGSGVTNFTIWGFVIDEGGVGPDLKGAIWMDGHSGNVNIVGNHIQGYSKPSSGGAASGLFLFNPDSFYIQGNEFGTSNSILDYQPISIHSTDATSPAGPLIISDNNVHGFQRFGIETLAQTQIMNIDRNNIHDVNAGSFLLSLADVSGVKTQNGTVIGNTFSGTTNTWGIELAQALTVSGNTMTNVTYGIVFAGTANGNPPTGTKAVAQSNTMTGVTNAFAEDGGYNGLLEWIGTNQVNGSSNTGGPVADPFGVGHAPGGPYNPPTPPLFAQSAVLCP